MTLEAAGWFAAREVNQIKAVLDDLASDRSEGPSAAADQQASIDICLKCGSPAREGLVFCTHCGHPLEGSEDG